MFGSKKSLGDQTSSCLVSKNLWEVKRLHVWFQKIFGRSNGIMFGLKKSLGDQTASCLVSKSLWEIRRLHVWSQKVFGQANSTNLRSQQSLNDQTARPAPFVIPFYDSSASIYDPVSYIFSQMVSIFNLEKN